MDTIKVLIVDDDKLVCASLKTILEAENDIVVKGLGHDGKKAIELYNSLKPDILLMDIRMDIMTGLEAGEIILKGAPDAKILYLTTFADDEYIVKALRIGTSGYLLKQNFECIVPSVRAVFSGQRVYGDEIMTRLPNLISTKTPVFSHSEISPKEQEIIACVAEGLNNKEIAQALYLSEGTVRNYLSIILEKLNLRDRTQLAIFYYKNQH